MQAIGSELKQIREQKGYSLEDVQGATKIRTSYLEAIEAGNLDALPGPVYARGFIKSYAEFLEINGQELIERHGLGADTQAPPVDTPRSARPKQEAAPKKTSQAVVGTPSQTTSKLANTRMIPQIVAVVGVFAVLTLAYVFLLGRDGDSSQTQGDEVKTQQTAEQPVPQATPQPAPTPAPAPQPAPEPPKPKTTVEQVEKGQNRTTYAVTTAEPMTLVLNATANCWVQVEADGKIIESATVQAGQSRTWQAQKSLSILTGNSKGITMKLNEQAVQFEPQLRGYTYAFQQKQP